MVHKMKSPDKVEQRLDRKATRRARQLDRKEVRKMDIHMSYINEVLTTNPRNQRGARA